MEIHISVLLLPTYIYLQSFQVPEFCECSRLNVCDAVISKRSAAVIKEGYRLCVHKERKLAEPICWSGQELEGRDMFSIAEKRRMSRKKGGIQAKEGSIKAIL